MDKSKIIKEIVDKIKSEEPEKIILFGSYAYGTPDIDSDIDLLVIKNIDKKDIRDFRIKLKLLLWDIITTKNIPIDILVDNEKRINQRIKKGDLFYKEIITRGSVIYA